MAAPKPTHAYVEYKDGDKAIVAVSLIKRYSPNDVTELANNKLVCWRKSRNGYLADRYIRGDVLTLGYGIDDLVARMLKQGKIVPKKVLVDSSQGIRLKKSTLQGAKQRQHHSKVPKKPATSKILGKRRREDLDSETEEEEEEQVPRRLLQEADNKIAELEERLRVSEERLHEERQQNVKLQNLLEQKMDSMEASIIAAIKSEQHGARLASQLFRHGTGTGHSICYVEGTFDNDETSVVNWSRGQGRTMARITTSSTSRLQYVCPCSTCSSREGFPEHKSTQKVDEELGLTCNAAIAPSEMEESRNADGKAALGHIASCLLSQDIKCHDIAVTIFQGNFSPALCALMEEFHSRLRRPSWATERGKWAMEAAFVLNYLSGCVTLLGTLWFLYVISNLKKFIKATGWVRDLCTDGDVESNPGPVSFPTTYEEMSGPTFFDWLRDKEGQGTDMLSGAWASLSNRACADVNTAVIENVSWHSGRPGQSKRLRLGTWTTLLYPTSVHGPQQLLSATEIRCEDAHDKHINSVPSLDLRFLVNPPSPQGQPGAFPAELGKGPPFFAVGPAQQKGRTRSEPVVEDTGAAGRQRQLSPFSPPSPSDVVVAAVGRTGNVLSSSIAMGQGVAFPLSGGGQYPFLHRQGTVAIVIGKGVPDCGTLTGLTYAYRIPITVTQKGKEGPGVVRLGGKIVPEGDAMALRALCTKNSPTLMLANGSKVSLVGEWLPLEGNGTHTISYIRRWGPPHFVYRAETAAPRGTALTCTAMTKEEREHLKHTVITSDTDITALRLLMSSPYSTTCEASAFKLGLMLAWAKYGVQDAACFNVLTGQSQVHEPEVFIKEESTVTRLFNSSGVPDEDCGGLIQPAFPFSNGWKRGHLSFFASERCVPRGAPFLILPSCFEQGGSFAEAAVYLMSLLPWPWGNMSIVLETGADGDPTPRKQMYTWYGATTIVPGARCINVVLNRSSALYSSSMEYGEPPLAQYPTMGPTAVEFWPPFSPIPVNFEAGQDHFVPTSAFAASWALGYDVATITNVLAKIQVHGLFDNVGRWVLEAPLFAMSHAGIMATQKVQMLDVPAEQDVRSLRPTIPATMDDDDDVPLLYRCWAAPGYRIRHIPKGAVWADVVLPPDGLITLPDITTLSAVNSGLWCFDNPFAGTTISVDHPLLSAIQFIASEQLFVGWHIFHSAMGVATDSMQLGSSKKWLGRGENAYFDGVFGEGSGQTPDFGNLVQGVIAKVVNGPVLTTVTGVPLPYRLFPQHHWEPQVLDFTNVVHIAKACPTPMTDVVVFKYSSSVPREFLPFLVSRAALGNKDIFDAQIRGRPCYSYIGPFLYAGGPDCIRVQRDDMLEVSPHSLWQNRLMHSRSMYELRDYVTGDPVAGTPVPGEAPTEFPRCHDEWADSSFDFGTKMTPYPFFSTVWSGWMDSATRHVLALQEEAEWSGWDIQLATGVGSEASGVRFELN